MMKMIKLGSIKGMEMVAFNYEKQYRMCMPNTGEQKVWLHINSNPIQPLEAATFKGWVQIESDNKLTTIFADEIIICTVEGVVTCIKAFGYVGVIYNSGGEDYID